MKRAFLALALVGIVGAASAQTVTMPPVGGATITTPQVGSGSVTTPGVIPPAVSVPNTVSAPAPNAAGSAGARARIEADGYRDVQGLNRGADGKWRGQATRGNARVGVSVDAQGRVTTDQHGRPRQYRSPASSQEGGLSALPPPWKPAIVSKRLKGSFVCRTSQPQTPISLRRNS